MMKDGRETPLFLHAFALERLSGRPVREVAIVDVRSGEVRTSAWRDEERHFIATELVRSSITGGTVQ